MIFPQKNECCSDVMSEKLHRLDAILRVAQRTLDSPDSSIYISEISSLIATAGEMTAECERLRQQMDVTIYQKNSKYYSETHSS
ncbi:hypothetical protein [Pectobacterium carotovorum]|uniref:hypothetical protein n=1 Tax=Pectobacterium brasiliense TaxID=180957 RepID=UPI000B96C1FD|nr:hypothetical protein [Pectobacterium carotovorum]